MFIELVLLGAEVLLSTYLTHLLPSVLCFFLMEFFFQLQELSLDLFFSIPADLFYCSQSVFSFVDISMPLRAGHFGAASLTSEALGSKRSRPGAEASVTAFCQVHALVLPSSIPHSGFVELKSTSVY